MHIIKMLRMLAPPLPGKIQIAHGRIYCYGAAVSYDRVKDTLPYAGFYLKSGGTVGVNSKGVHHADSQSDI